MEWKLVAGSAWGNRTKIHQISEWIIRTTSKNSPIFTNLSWILSLSLSFSHAFSIANTFSNPSFVCLYISLSLFLSLCLSHFLWFSISIVMWLWWCRCSGLRFGHTSTWLLVRSLACWRPQTTDIWSLRSTISLSF